MLKLLILWIFISCFFSSDLHASWMGAYDGYYQVESVWQYLFYFVVAVAAIRLKKENVKYLFSLFITVACLVMLIQFGMGDYSFGFIHKNHTGYYICMTFMMSVGLFFFSKNILESIFLMFSIILHLISFVLNGSMGPIFGLIAFFVCGLVYILIHKRELFIKFLSIFACFIVVFTIFDFSPILKDYRDEPASTLDKISGITLVVLNKIGIISDDFVEESEVPAGSDGYGRLDLWKLALKDMKENPLFGVGIGSWKGYHEGLDSFKPHNEVLQYGIIAGYPAVIIYIVLILYLFIKFRKNHKTKNNLSFIILSILFVYLVQSMFGCMMPFTSPLYFLVLGLSIKFIDIKDDNINLKNENS